MTWRLVDSDLSEPAFTFAADEAMAIARSSNKVPNTLHFYRRNVPTVSLGYFQKVKDAVDMDFCLANGVRVIRRVTGGSAIYTDPGHLIYGLALDEGVVPSGREKSMEFICQAIVLALMELGVESVFKPVNDVLVAGRKISGSAQRRRSGIVLQHGTLVLDNRADMMLGSLRTDIAKARERGLEPERYVTSLSEVLGHEADIPKVKAALVNGFEQVFDVDFEKMEFSNPEKDNIRDLVKSKYTKDEWNLKF